MLNKIRDFIFVSKDLPTNEIEPSFLEKAISHYCQTCEKFFKTKAARNAHMSIKHKND